MLLRFAFLLLFPFQYLVGSVIANEEELYSEGPMPSWVVPMEFPLPIETKGSHLQFLLMDSQENWPEHTQYYHMAVKILTQTGVEAVGQLDIGFEPSFQKLLIHDVRIYRDGMWIDQKNSRHDLLQREEELEENLISGELTMVYFLEDIRPGDILEYAYSTVGTNPLFASHYFDRTAFQINFYIEKISHRLLTYPDHCFAIKPYNAAIEPIVRDRSDTLREWHWEVIQPEVYIEEESEPDWYQSVAFIEMSDYRNWGEVAAQIVPLFSLPEDFDVSIPTEMANLVSGWKGTQEERALAALRFVQDEVRYLGFEEGIMGHTPHDPRLVFQQRFGDCKDKTFLLHALLHLMDISSTPILVDTRAGKALTEMLPIPSAFNHIILQMTIDGIDYCVDSTISLQGGSLKDNFFPNYYWGLPLIEGANSLIALPTYVLERPTEVSTLIKVISEDKAELTVLWTAFGAKADSYRQYVQQVGLLNLSEDSLNALQKKHGHVSIKLPMSIVDDRKKNIFNLHESYVIPLRKRAGKTILHVSSIVVKSFLSVDFNPNRTSPYALTYPLWIKEHIHIDNPFANWKNEEEEIKFDFDSIYYNFHSKIGSQNVDLFHELKHCSDYIPVKEIQDYWDAAKEVEAYGFLDFKVK